MPRRSVSWWAPGRVNLIGEHTDYNDGFALPFAIEQGCTATVEVTGAADIVVASAQRPDAQSVALDALADAAVGWARYVFGVAWTLQRRGVPVPGMRVEVDSNVPQGAGLASSAALICSVAAAMNDVLDLGLTTDDLVAVTRSAENEFVGAPTGGLDQLAALRCTAGNALLCDFRSASTQPVQLAPETAGLSILVIDTRTHHEHATGEYAARRAGCAEAARRLGVPALRDVDIDGLADALLRLESGALWRYVRHVVTENDRVLQTFALLNRGQVAAIGPTLTASHESLRDEYRVSVAQLDVAVEAALDAGAHGARMTGGGFGGCAIALLDADLVDECAAAVTAAFSANDFAAPRVFRTRPGPSAHRVG